MSNYQAVGGVFGRRDKKLTSNAATTIVDGNDAIAVVSLRVAEINGGTPNFTLTIVNNAGATIFLRSAVAMTARERIVYDEGWPLNPGDLLKATSSDAAGLVDLVAVVIERGQQ